ncbi:RNA-binding protein 5, putative [Leishmania tarentolae]|uniref:RNA-binding protein 5, putative n=1 Tax=Leishmania tarentolae TaxID=5689 RepID=A0A640K964_LEITA|nr:RNA-binding protein 5, putative [Leishmania tarentolae]
MTLVTEDGIHFGRSIVILQCTQPCTNGTGLYMGEDTYMTYTGWYGMQALISCCCIITGYIFLAEASGRAKRTCTRVFRIQWPWSAITAFSASCSFSNKTKPYPLHSPVSLSYFTVQEMTRPKGENRSSRSFSE